MVHTISMCKSLVEIEIPDQIVNIPDNTFSYCSSLTSIVIPENVMQIGKDAFAWCSGLKTIISKATIPPYCQSSTFYGVDKANCQLFVPEGSVDAYKNDSYWKEFYNCSNIATISTDKKIDIVYSLSGYSINGENKGISIINNGGTLRVILVR